MKYKGNHKVTVSASLRKKHQSDTSEFKKKNQKVFFNKQTLLWTHCIAVKFREKIIHLHDLLENTKKIHYSLLIREENTSSIDKEKL